MMNIMSKINSNKGIHDKIASQKNPVGKANIGHDHVLMTRILEVAE